MINVEFTFCLVLPIYVNKFTDNNKDSNCNIYYLLNNYYMFAL